jgi:hypothetical protein
MLAALVIIGAALGPVAQGTFSRVKAELEFVGALIMFGFPQSMFFYVHASRLSVARARSLARDSAVLGGVTAAAYALLSLHWVNLSAISFSAAVAAFVWHGSLRAVVLSAVSTRAFNLVTAMPQGLLFVYALLALALGRVAHFDVGVAFALSFLTAGVVAVIALNAVSRGQIGCVQDEVPLSDVLRYGAASGLVAVGSTLSLLLALRKVLSALGPVNLGVFSLAAALAQGVLIPLNYVVPLLFKRWMQQPTTSLPLLGGLLAATGLCCLAAAAYFVARCSMCGRILGSYASITGVLWILVLAAAADACHKIVAVAANACGRPWLPTFSEGARVSIIGVGVVVLPITNLRVVSWLVCGAAAIAALIVVMLYHSRTYSKIVS